MQFGPPVEPATVQAGEGFTGIGLPENDIFYFHPDHLGSTSYITTRNGSISQHVEYIAFGEVLFEEHSSSFSSPYLFNGKELDRETNLSCYGARYLDMKTSLWLNVDPLAEKFFNQSPYNYCFNNPLNLIDPDGRGPDDTESDPPKKGTYLIIYGAGADNPAWKTHDVKGGFKKSAEAQRENLIKSGVPESSIVVGQATTEQQFLDLTNKEYDSGKIVQMDVYSHMSFNAINFGGDANSESLDATNGQKDYRNLNSLPLGNFSFSDYNPDNDDEVLKINASNFKKNAQINLWGCNAGSILSGFGGIAQDFANHLNSENVYGFGGFSRFKTNSNGTEKYDGTMIREKDKNTQKVNLTRFKPNPR